MFPLSKIYVWVSLFCAFLGAVILSAIFHHFSVVNLKDIGERDSVALTQSFANTLGPELIEWVGEAATLSAEEIKEHEQTQQLLAQAKQQMRATDVSKIKIYALNGKTVFSSEVRQIGEDKSANAGFLAALSGKVATELTYRDKFSAFERVILNRNLLATYLPIRDRQTARVVVVFELYNDVTELLEEIKRTGQLVMVAVVLVLLAMFGAQYLFVRHANRKMIAQHDELQSHSIQLTANCNELEQKVSELSAQLVNTKAGMEKAWASARQADQSSSQVFSSIANAIREPIEGISQAVRQLGESPLAGNQRSLLDNVQRNSEALRKSVMQLLERATAQNRAGEKVALAESALKTPTENTTVSGPKSPEIEPAESDDDDVEFKIS